MSTSKEEYTTRSLVALQALCLQKLLADFSYEQKESTKIFPNINNCYG